MPPKLANFPVLLDRPASLARGSKARPAIAGHAIIPTQTNRTAGSASLGKLLAAITAADIAQPGSVLVFVFNPPEMNTASVSGAIGNSVVIGCSGKDSNAVSFTVSP